MRHNDDEHTHKCSRCGAKVPCPGTLVENHDGWPSVVCIAVEIGGITVICNDCFDKEKKS